MWLHSQGVNYIDYRENASVVEQLTFSTERKYMATIVKASQGEQLLYIKGAPEIVFSKCSRVLTAEGLKPVAEYGEEVEKQLLAYQNQARRTLGFAYKTINCKGGDCI
ncbi:MAG: hypothetical protein ACLTXP_17035 [Odoribacter splanchnicus]